MVIMHVNGCKLTRKFPNSQPESHFPLGNNLFWLLLHHLCYLLLAIWSLPDFHQTVDVTCPLGPQLCILHCRPWLFTVHSGQPVFSRRISSILVSVVHVRAYTDVHS